MPPKDIIRRQNAWMSRPTNVVCPPNPVISGLSLMATRNVSAAPRAELQELFNQFIAEQRFTVSKREDTVRGYESTFILFTKIMGDVSVGALTPALLTEFFQRLGTRTRIIGSPDKPYAKTGVKPSTIATYRSKLNTFFLWLVRKGLLNESPFKAIPYPRVEYSDRKYIPQADLKKILAAVAAGIEWGSNLVRKRNLAIFDIGIGCGLRRGEILGLQVTDINFQKSELLVRGETSKSKRDRYLVINTQVRHTLLDYMEERKSRKYSTPFLFVSDTRDRGLSKAGLKHMLETVKQGSRVDFHIHQLRHTFSVNWLVQTKGDIVGLHKALGHSDIRMTMAYLRCIPAEYQRANFELLANLDRFI